MAPTLLGPRRDTPTDLNARVNPAAHCVVMAPPPGVNPGGHAASDAMYGDTTAADATMNERFYSLYAKGKTPPGSSIPATTSNDTNTADDETNQLAPGTTSPSTTYAPSSPR